jgi:hypothetical protein
MSQGIRKVDAHVITQEEYDEAPELTEEWFARAAPMIGGCVAGADEFRAAVKKAIGRAAGDEPRPPCRVGYQQNRQCR